MPNFSIISVITPENSLTELGSVFEVFSCISKLNVLQVEQLKIIILHGGNTYLGYNSYWYAALSASGIVCFLGNISLSHTAWAWLQRASLIRLGENILMA